MRFATVLSLAIIGSSSALDAQLSLRPANDAKMIEYINSLNTTWRADTQSRFEGLTLGDVAQLCGVKKGGPVLPKRPAFKTPMDTPASFDSRSQWKSMCPSVNEIRDQAACGSCWAFGAAEAITDRTCIASKGSFTIDLSAEDINSCCDFCGSGCDGGFPSAAWQYWVDTGVVTGGLYDSHVGCAPYTVPSCDHHEPGPLQPCGNIVPTPNCPNQCEAGYAKTWKEDKHHGKTSYSLDMSNVYQDIMTYGPIESSFTVYSDFPTYRSGIYQPHSSEELGGHAIKIVGWGEDSGVQYWWVANSWNPSWGDHGYFRIIRGVDSCGIEDGFVAGHADIPAAYLAVEYE